MLIESLGAASLVMLVSLTGIVFTHQVARSYIEARLSYLVSFSAGVFLITAGALAVEVFHISDSFLLGVVLIAAGYLLAWGIQYLLPEVHHHHDDDCGQSQSGARKLIIGDAIHNVADGIVLVTAFSVSSVIGIAALVSIIIHEALQEVSEFFVLRGVGYSTSKALSINALVSSTILIGVMLGYFALASHELEVVLLALSAGFFLHVVFHDLLPRRDQHESTKEFFVHLGLVIGGAALMGLVAGALNDEHTHGEESDHAKEEVMHEAEGGSVSH